MQITIGDNIKRLRKERDITQEKLSEALNVSVTAVSKWERGETYPDITLIFPLAHYFDVSVDELMGYNKEKIEQDIKDTLAEYRKLQRNYAEKSVLDRFISDAYQKYPNDFRVMRTYMWSKSDYADCDNESLLENKEELELICDKILQGCNDNDIVLDAKNMKAKLLHAQGKTEEAIKIYKNEFPDFLQNAHQKIEQLFTKDSEEYLYWNKINIYEYIDFTAMKIARMVWYDKALDKKEKVVKCEQIVDLLSTARRVTNEGFFVVLEKSLIEQYIYLMAANNGDIDDIARFLDKFLDSARAETEFVKYDKALRDGILVPYKTENVLKFHIDNWRTSNHWSLVELRNEEKIKAVLDKYDK
ncbi:MAG: helix-turn-helix transcriptional regulator [Clostridia bacterium]|nr:helix-turn-helix transcriptional regulator [Clostridia bacterium]